MNPSRAGDVAAHDVPRHDVVGGCGGGTTPRLTLEPDGPSARPGRSSRPRQDPRRGSREQALSTDPVARRVLPEGSAHFPALHMLHRVVDEKHLVVTLSRPRSQRDTAMILINTGLLAKPANLARTPVSQAETAPDASGGRHRSVVQGQGRGVQGRDGVVHHPGV